MAKQQTARKQNIKNYEENERPTSLVALEAHFSNEQLEALRRVAVLLAASALKVARERGILK